MKKVVVLVVFVIGIGAMVWLLDPYQLRHRFRIFLTQMPEGKNYQNEADKHKNLYVNPLPIVFLGDSHMEQCEWHEVFPQYEIANRGIGGDGTASLTARVDAALRPGTKLVFLQIGVNDILTGVSPQTVFEQYKTLISKLKDRNLRVVSTLPFFTSYQTGVNDKIANLNQNLAQWLPEQGVTVLDLNPKLSQNRHLKTEFTLDGIHLNPAGYTLWINALKPVIQAEMPSAADFR